MYSLFTIFMITMDIQIDTSRVYLYVYPVFGISDFLLCTMSNEIQYMLLYTVYYDVNIGK